MSTTTNLEIKTSELTCADATETFSEVIGVPFGEYMTSSEIANLTGSKNKGAVGQLAEVLLGKHLDSDHLDFADGEMKSVTTDEKGVMPSGQSICLTNLGVHVDEMLDLVDFEECWAGEKARHMVLVGICRPDKDDASTWFVTKVLDCDFANDERLASIWEQLCREYSELSLRSLEMVMETGHLGGCAKGLSYVEHRPKNAGKTVSSLCGGAVIYNKIKAIYFKRTFFNDVVSAMAA